MSVIRTVERVQRYINDVLFEQFPLEFNKDTKIDTDISSISRKVKNKNLALNQFFANRDKQKQLNSHHYKEIKNQLVENPEFTTQKQILNDFINAMMKDSMVLSGEYGLFFNDYSITKGYSSSIYSSAWTKPSIRLFLWAFNNLEDYEIYPAMDAPFWHTLSYDCNILIRAKFKRPLPKTSEYTLYNIVIYSTSDKRFMVKVHYDCSSKKFYDALSCSYIFNSLSEISYFFGLPVEELAESFLKHKQYMVNLVNTTTTILE